MLHYQIYANEKGTRFHVCKWGGFGIVWNQIGLWVGHSTTIQGAVDIVTLLRGEKEARIYFLDSGQSIDQK